MNGRRTTQKEIDLSFLALDVLSGRADEQLTLDDEPDYERYSQGKKKLYEECASRAEYDEKLKILITECGV